MEKNLLSLEAIRSYFNYGGKPESWKDDIWFGDEV